MRIPITIIPNSHIQSEIHILSSRLQNAIRNNSFHFDQMQLYNLELVTEMQFSTHAIPYQYSLRTMLTTTNEATHKWHWNICHCNAAFGRASKRTKTNAQQSKKQCKIVQFIKVISIRIIFQIFPTQKCRSLYLLQLQSFVTQIFRWIIPKKTILVINAFVLNLNVALKEQ